MTRTCARTLIRRTLFVLSGALAAVGVATAQEIATLESHAGQVTVLRAGQPRTPSPAMPLLRDDIVVTRQGRATVRFNTDGSVMRVGPESRIQVDENATSGTSSSSSAASGRT